MRARYGNMVPDTGTRTFRSERPLERKGEKEKERTKERMEGNFAATLFTEALLRILLLGCY
jgi:hypothetical protein